MGHERSRHAQVDAGSRVGARHRHTTPDMAIRVMTAIDQRLAVVLRVAEAITQAHPSTRVFWLREPPRVYRRLGCLSPTVRLGSSL
jgi:hypothetical protein